MALQAIYGVLFPDKHQAHKRGVLCTMAKGRDGWYVPQRRGSDQDILSLPLTRRQRSIYLLADGRRTISDLSRCTGKSVQEVERILSELQEQGLLFL